MTAPFHIGQQVIVSYNRWTPEGWVPVEEAAVVIDPCVGDDHVYAGDVEVKAGEWLNRQFYSPDDVRAAA